LNRLPYSALARCVPGVLRRVYLALFFRPASATPARIPAMHVTIASLFLLEILAFRAINRDLGRTAKTMGNLLHYLPRP